MGERLYVRRGDAFAGTLTVYVDGTADSTTNAGSDFVAELRSQRGQLLRTLDATAGAGAGEIDFLDSNGTGAWPIGVVVFCVSWVDSTGASRTLFPPIEVECVTSSEAAVLELSTTAFLQRGADSSGQIGHFFGALGGSSGGSGLDQLTGDVTAGPGSGSQTASVVAIRGQPVSSASPSSGDVLTWDGAQWEAAAASSDAASIQGQPVSAVTPNAGDVLTWDGAQWQAAAPSGGGLTDYQARKRIVFAGAL